MKVLRIPMHIVASAYAKALDRKGTFEEFHNELCKYAGEELEFYQTLPRLRRWYDYVHKRDRRPSYLIMPDRSNRDPLQYFLDEYTEKNDRLDLE